MKPAPKAPSTGPDRPGHTAVPPPAPTGNPLIDEVRAMKYELSARFDHDIEKLGAYLKTVQEEIARHAPQRVIRQPDNQ